MKRWLVTGTNENGFIWVLEFVGDEKPNRGRINHAFASEYPEQWEFEPEIRKIKIREFTDAPPHATLGLSLKKGFNLNGEEIEY
jgi:hypothetical protein